MTRAAPPVPILFEDSHLLVVFKPPGWVVQGAHERQVSLPREVGAWIRLRDEKPGNVFLAVTHRLDRPVSGIVVLAKRSKAASRISREIREGRFEKVYRAVVEGVPEPPKAKCVGILAWNDMEKRARILSADEVDVPEAGSDPGKKLARVELEYALLEARPRHSLLEIRPATGRKHQIRAQLAHLGHPIAGDQKYGAVSHLAEGIALLAYRVRFRHPVREEEIEIEVPAELDPTPGWLASLRLAPVTNVARETHREGR